MTGCPDQLSLDAHKQQGHGGLTAECREQLRLREVVARRERPDAGKGVGAGKVHAASDRDLPQQIKIPVRGAMLVSNSEIPIAAHGHISSAQQD